MRKSVALLCGLALGACESGPTQPEHHVDPQAAARTTSSAVAATCELATCLPGFGGQPGRGSGAAPPSQTAVVTGTWQLGDPGDGLVFDFGTDQIAVLNGWEGEVLTGVAVFEYTVEDRILAFGEGLRYAPVEPDDASEEYEEFDTIEGAQYRVDRYLETNPRNFTFLPSVSVAGDELTLGVLIDAEIGEFGEGPTLARTDRNMVVPGGLPPLTQAERIVGVWDLAEASSPETAEFRADGSYIYNTEFCCPADGKVDQIVVGRWTIETRIAEDGERASFLKTTPQSMLELWEEFEFDAERQVYILNGQHEVTPDEVALIGDALYLIVDDEAAPLSDDEWVDVGVSHMYASDRDWVKADREVVAP